MLVSEYVRELFDSTEFLLKSGIGASGLSLTKPDRENKLRICIEFPSLAVPCSLLGDFVTDLIVNFTEFQKIDFEIMS